MCPRLRRCRNRFAIGAVAVGLGLGPRTTQAVCDLSRPDLAGFLSRTQAFYANGVFHDHTWVNEFVSRREEYVSTCAAAALQALLLKLEENLVYEPDAYEHVLTVYANVLHTGVSTGGLSREDMRMWPLDVGLQRVAEIKDKLRDRVEGHLSSAMVMNFCQAMDRFGEVHELEWLLRPPFGQQLTPSAPAALDTQTIANNWTGVHSGLLLSTDLYIYLVDAPKCSGPSASTMEQLKLVARSVHLIPYKGGPHREEQTAYFKFIADHYDALPDFTIFVHPDAPEHQGEHFSALQRALRVIHTNSAFARDAIGYYPLAQQMVVHPKRAWGTRFISSWRKFWQNMFTSSWRQFASPPPRCRWTKHFTKYLAGLVDGIDQRLSVTEAKALCAERDDCVGITCGTPLDVEEFSTQTMPSTMSNSCTARRGEPAGLHESPTTEVSFMKFCVPPGSGSAHPDAAFFSSDDEGHFGEEADLPASEYTRVENAFLAGYANDEDDLADAADRRTRCDQLGRLCGGITCKDTTEGECSVRASKELWSSPHGEVSYAKGSFKSEGEAALASAGTLPADLPRVGGPSSVFQMYTGSQSIVAAERLRIIPREWYAAMAANGPFCSEYTGLLEAVWHAMFGEPLVQWTRQEDPRLPLFLKWGVPTLLSQGDEGVI